MFDIVSNSRAFVAATLLASPLGTAVAQVPSDKPVRLIVAFAAGGAGDQVARMVSGKLTHIIGRPVLVENKPGAGGNIASQFVATAPPDGNTFLITSNNHTTNTVLYKNAGYTLNDLIPVVELMRGPIVVVVPSAGPQKDIEDLISTAKTTPLSYGSIGVGSSSHLLAECLKFNTGAKLEHVPYKGGAPAVADVVAGHIPVVFTTLASAGTFVRAGKLRALALSSPVRWSTFPDIPTLAERGFGACTYEAWLGLMAPQGTPAAIVSAMNRDVASIMKSVDARDRLAPQGYVPVGDSPQKFAEMINADLQKTSDLIKRSGMSAD